MKRLRIVAPLLVVVLLVAACQSAQTQLPPTAVPTTAPTGAPTAVPATLAPTTAPATLAASATAAATAAATLAVTVAATLAPTAVPAATTQGPVMATTFPLLAPWGVVADAGGNFYVSTCPLDSNLPAVDQIFKVDPAGMLQVYAGVSLGFSGDGGPASLAKFFCLGGLAFGADGSLYVADQGNNRIRRIDKNGTVSTVAGSGDGVDVLGKKPMCCVGSFAGDGGPATAAALWNPTDIAFDPQGNLYIADHNNDRVRKVDPQGVITTVAGSGTEGFSGDGGPATKAQLNTATPYVVTPDVAWAPSASMSLAFDAAGNLYISDTGNARVRKVDLKGIITTIAGTGKPGFSGDGGPAKSAQLSNPGGLAFDAEGNLYIADGPTLTFKSNRIRKIDKAGIITTIAGTDADGFSGDGGPASAASLAGPGNISFDAQGNLYFADGGNNRVRKIDKSGIITTVAGDGTAPQ